MREVAFLAHVTMTIIFKVTTFLGFVLRQIHLLRRVVKITFVVHLFELVIGLHLVGGLINSWLVQLGVHLLIVLRLLLFFNFVLLSFLNVIVHNLAQCL